MYSSQWMYISISCKTISIQYVQNDIKWNRLSHDGTHITKDTVCMKMFNRQQQQHKVCKLDLLEKKQNCLACLSFI